MGPIKEILLFTDTGVYVRRLSGEEKPATQKDIERLLREE